MAYGCVYGTAAKQSSHKNGLEHAKSFCIRPRLEDPCTEFSGLNRPEFGEWYLQILQLSGWTTRKRKPAAWLEVRGHPAERPRGVKDQGPRARTAYRSRVRCMGIEIDH